ncbi:MAG: phasin family protein [Pseudomonadota bacterium]
MASVSAEKAKNVEAVIAAPASVNPAPVAKTVAEPVVDAKPIVAVPAKPVVSVKPAPVAKEVTAKPAEKIAAKAIATPKTLPFKTKAAPLKAAASTKGKTMTDTVKTMTAEAGEKATEMFKDVTARAKTAFAKSGEIAKDVAEFNKDNLEAVVESGKIAAKGVQTAAQTAADFTRKNFEATTSMLKTAAAVKSPTELLKVQSDFAKGQFEAAIAEMSKSSEFTLKLMGEMFQPISNRYSVAAEIVKTRLAA